MDVVDTCFIKIHVGTGECWFVHVHGYKPHLYHCRALNISSAVFILLSVNAEGGAQVRPKTPKSLPSFRH